MLKFLCCVLCLYLWRFRVDAWWWQNENVVNEFESEPFVFQYNKNGGLNIVLTLQNVPSEANSYEIYEIDDRSHAKVIHDGRWVSPERPESKEESTKLVQFDVNLRKSNSRTIFEVSLKTKGVNCNRRLNRKFLKIVYTEVEQPVNKQCNIKLDWKKECYDIPSPKTTDTSAEYPSPPEVNPQNFTDYGHPFAVFTCSARCYPDEVLVWYQDKSSHDPTILLVNQTYERDKHLTSSIIYMQITLNKTLENADQNTSLFCGRRVINRNAYGELSLAIPTNATKDVTSQNIYINFDGNKTTETPEVTTEPNGVVNFEPNSWVEFVCSSTLVDGLTLTWYEEDHNSKRQLPSNQSLNGTTMRNTLKLFVEAYVSKSIYCVQEHQLRYWDKYQFYDFPYGQIARSEPISFQTQKADDRSHKLMIAGACVVGALVMLLAGLMVSRRWRRQTSGEEEEGDYAVPQITYAVLALPETDSKPPNKPDKQNYVEIVGVYKNKK